jgi:hypothetical protein
VSSGDPLPAALPATLTDGLGRIRQGEWKKDTVLLRFEAAGATPYVTAWRVAARPDAARPEILGIVANQALVTDVFAQIVKNSPLLPPTLAGDSRELLAVRVSTPDGRDIFSSSPTWSQYASESVLESVFEPPCRSRRLTA